MSAKQALPEDFPGKKQLDAAGLDSVEAVRAMSEEELTGIDGIGPKTAADIRAWFDAGEAGDAEEGQGGAEVASCGTRRATRCASSNQWPSPSTPASATP
jgi:NAD-dependent DNA ligase